MNSDDSSYAIPVPEKTALSSTNAAKKTTAASEPELQAPLAEDGDEWEGFYEDDKYEEF